MDREQEQIELCRLYKGEVDNPYSGTQNKAAIWDYERAWVIESLRPKMPLLLEYIGEYISSGLARFSSCDGVPLSLKALLFNRYARTHYSMIDAVEPFKDFYKTYFAD